MEGVASLLPFLLGEKSIVSIDGDEAVTSLCGYTL
jgi:hypothetical protein